MCLGFITWWVSPPSSWFFPSLVSASTAFGRSANATRGEPCIAKAAHKNRPMDRVIYERMVATLEVQRWFAGRRLAGYWPVCATLLIASLAPIWMVTLPPLDD